LLEAEEDRRDGAGDRKIDAKIEKEDRADRQPVFLVPRPDAAQEVAMHDPAPVAAGEAAAETDAGEHQRLDPHCATRCLDALGLLDEGEGDGDEQAADEAAARLVVTTQEDEDGQREDERRQEPGRRREDEGVHALRSLPAQSAARAAIPEMTMTETSPIVSRARKSTRMTLTMLRPCASARLVASKKSVRRRSSGVPRTASMAAVIARPNRTAITALIRWKGM